MRERDYGQPPAFFEGQWRFSGSDDAKVQLIQQLPIANLHFSDRVILGFDNQSVTLLVEGVATEWVDLGVAAGVRLDLVPTGDRQFVRLPANSVCRVGESLTFFERDSRSALFAIQRVRWIAYRRFEMGLDRDFALTTGR